MGGTVHYMLCDICHKELADGIPLSDGRMLHSACINMLNRKLLETEKEYDDYKLQSKLGQQLYAKQRSLISNISFELTNRPNNIPKLKEQMLLVHSFINDRGMHLEIADISSNINDSFDQLAILNDHLAQYSGILTRIGHSIFGKPAALTEIEKAVTNKHSEIEILRRTLLRDLETIELSAQHIPHATKDDISAIKTRITSYYDYYLRYPPDWDDRKERVFQRDKKCKQCQKGFSLHVHHIMPLGKGGTNKLSNLVLLCDECHKKSHGVKEFKRSTEDRMATTSDIEHPSAFSERIRLINQAINSSKEIEFSYKKPTDNRPQKRIVKPYELKEVNRNDGVSKTLCVRGFCYLRNEDRTFALKRMRGLKIK